MNKAIQINIQILKKCREQMGLSQEDVKKKVKKIVEIEDADKEPTPNQLTTLAELYQVPRWVFIENKLPIEYQYEKMPAFSRFKKSEIFNLPKLRQLVSRIEQYRSLFLELRKDMDEPIPPFTSISPLDSAEQTAQAVRKWLNLNAPLDFDLLRERLEEQNIFIFMTSKYKGWSQIDKESFRGISIFHDILPIIVINESDYKKSQSFTLFHELGHLLKKNMAIGCENARKKEEKWCDELAGCVLMPLVESNVLNQSFDQLTEIKKVAKRFKISPYSCLVRLKQLGVIKQKKYMSFENQLKDEYKALQIKLQKELQKNDRGLPRYRHLEVKKQFGNSFIRSIFHTLHNKEITLHKTSQILGLKKPSQVLELEKSL